MSVEPREKPAPSGEGFRVRVEAVAWVTRLVGGDGSGRVAFDEVAQPGDTVRSILKRLSARFPQLDQALWDPRSGGLGEHLEVAVNDAVLGVRHNLDSEVEPGDHILLLGAYMGG
ncbi:MAG: MoaD/ThiS family protein [Nitrospinota bacterium]